MEQTLGKRIAANRKRLGLTQEQLADKLNITAQAVSKWENDQSCPDISVLPVLADIFGITTDELLGHRQLPSYHNTSSQETFEDTAPNDDDDEYQEDDGNRVHFHFDVDKSERLHRKGKLFLLASASLFLAVGILYLLAKLLNWDCSLWDILWPTSLLVFGVFGLIGKISLFWFACAGVGAFFLVSNIVPLPLELDKGILWAVIIIFCGVMLLLDALRNKRRMKFHTGDHVPSHKFDLDDGFLECENAFGEEHQVVTTELLTGGKINNSFGECTIDLSGVAAVADNCSIEVSCSFGELVLLVPRRYAVTQKASKSFASYDVSGHHDDLTEGSIFLNASVSFGEISVRYI